MYRLPFGEEKDERHSRAQTEPRDILFYREDSEVLFPNRRWRNFLFEEKHWETFIHEKGGETPSLYKGYKELAFSTRGGAQTVWLLYEEG